MADCRKVLEIQTKTSSDTNAGNIVIKNLHLLTKKSLLKGLNRGSTDSRRHRLD